MTAVPVLRTIGELSGIAVVSLALTWWFLSAMGLANPTAIDQFGRVAFLLYLPTFVPTMAIFEALGPMHKAWAMLAILIAISVQNILMWFGGKWALRQWRGAKS